MSGGAPGGKRCPYATRVRSGRAKRLKVFPRTVVAGGAGSPGEVLAVESDAIVIGCGEGALQLREVQAEGSRRLAVSEFLKGQKIPVGNRFFSLEQGDE